MERHPLNHSGANLIAAERVRQQSKHSFEDDVQEHMGGQLMDAAISCVLLRERSTLRGFDPRKHDGDRIQQLAVAGALIAAEIDRLLWYPVYGSDEAMQARKAKGRLGR